MIFLINHPRNFQSPGFQFLVLTTNSVNLPLLHYTRRFQSSIQALFMPNIKIKLAM